MLTTMHAVIILKTRPVALTGIPCTWAASGSILVTSNTFCVTIRKTKEIREMKQINSKLSSSLKIKI